MNTVPYYSKPQRLSGKRITNKQAAYYVAEKWEFVGSNLYAVRYENVHGLTYVVYSYGPHWPLLVCDPSGDWFYNASKYGPTTSKHMSHAVRDLFYDGIPQDRRLTVDQMKDKVRETAA